MKKKHYDWLVGLVVFLLTLDSYYFYNLGFSLNHLALPFMLLMLFRNKVVISKCLILLISYISFLVFYGFIVTLLSDDPVKLHTGVAIFVYMIVVSFWLSSIITCRFYSLIRAIEVTVIIHSLFLFFQFIAWYLFSINIDFVSPITGETSRVFGGYFYDYVVYRSSGLFVEPGSFSGVIGVFVSVLLWSNKGKLSLGVVIGLLAMLLSLSAIGLVSVILCSLYVMYTTKNVRLRIALMVVSALMAALIFIYLSARFTGSEAQDASLLHRLGDLAQITKSVIGIGFTTPSFGVNSLTLFAYWFIYFGLLSIPFLLYLIIKIVGSPVASFPVFVLMITKLVPTGGLFWLIIFMVLLKSNRSKYTKGHIRVAV